MLSLAFIYLACHLLSVAVAPTHADAISFGFLILAPLLAALGCGIRARTDAARDGWIAAAIATGLWSAGMAATMFGTLVSGKSNSVDAIGVLLLILYGVPLIYMLASTGREQLAVRILDGVLALTLGVLFLAHTFVFATAAGATDAGQIGLRTMFDVENVFVAFFSLIRFRAEPKRSRRSFFASLTFFAWVYMLVAGYINHFQADTDFGSITDPILDVPFLLLMWLAKGGGTNEPLHLVQGRAAYFVRAGSPLMLTSTLLAVATSLFNTRPTFAIAGFLAASLGTGLRNVLVQSRTFAESDKLGELARIDGLTGLANRRQFDQALEDEWNRALRAGDPFALLMIDVDHFKALNDAHGHQAGDDALRLVAEALASCATRGAHLVARYGGEEFGVIAPGADQEGAAALATAMRLAVAGLGIVSPTANGRLTVSIGVGYVPRVSSQDAEPLVAAADSALYAAKRAGRDMVMSTDPVSGFLQRQGSAPCCDLPGARAPHALHETEACQAVADQQSRAMMTERLDIMVAGLHRAPEWVRHDFAAEDPSGRQRAHEALAAMISAALDAKL